MYIFEKLIVAQLLKKFVPFYATLKCITVFTGGILFWTVWYSGSILCVCVCVIELRESSVSAPQCVYPKFIKSSNNHKDYNTEHQTSEDWIKCCIVDWHTRPIWKPVREEELCLGHIIVDPIFVETELWQKHRYFYDMEAETLTFIREKHFSKLL